MVLGGPYAVKRIDILSPEFSPIPDIFQNAYSNRFPPQFFIFTNFHLFIFYFTVVFKMSLFSLNIRNSRSQFFIAL